MARTQIERTAWRPEADNVSGLSFEKYRRSLIHETEDIKDFLSESDGEHFIISAPKGFGKTLLLIAKSKQLDEHQRYSTPTTSRTGIIDSPHGRFPELSRERIESLSGYSLMKDLWALSIMVAAVKFEAQETGRDLNHVECDSWIMARLFGDTKTYSPCQAFADLICEDIKVMYRVLGSQQSLNAYFDDIQTPIVFFIDNVDEYFEPMLESRGLVVADRQASSHRNKSNALWTIAQLGLVGAAHKFHQTNSNVQVYCTIRQEAFRHLV